jgi:hypothetical protein
MILSPPVPLSVREPSRLLLIRLFQLTASSSGDDADANAMSCGELKQPDKQEPSWNRSVNHSNEYDKSRLGVREFHKGYRPMRRTQTRNSKFSTDNPFHVQLPPLKLGVVRSPHPRKDSRIAAESDAIRRSYRRPTGTNRLAIEVSQKHKYQGSRIQISHFIYNIAIVYTKNIENECTAGCCLSRSRHVSNFTGRRSRRQCKGPVAHSPEEVVAMAFPAPAPIAGRVLSTG